MSQGPLPPEDRAFDALRGSQPPQAEPAFQERLRRSFASGSLQPSLRPDRSRAMTWAAGVAAAAAVVVVLMLNAGPRWTLDGVTGSGTLSVDGRELAAHDLAAIRRAVHPGARVRTRADVQVDLRLPGLLTLQIAPGSEATIPTSPNRWFARRTRGGVIAGEVRVVTATRFRGATLSLSTAEARIEVSGTTFAVIRDSISSCVCVLEGEVAMSGPGASERVSAGTRRTLFRDGRPPLVEPIRPMEVMKLTMLRERAEAQDQKAPE